MDNALTFVFMLSKSGGDCSGKHDILYTNKRIDYCSFNDCIVLYLTNLYTYRIVGVHLVIQYSNIIQ